MIYCNYTKFPNILDKKSLNSILDKNIDKDYIEFLLKGIKLIDLKIQFGYDSDDFIRDLISCVITRKGIRVPRFIRNHLLNIYARTRIPNKTYRPNN